jgi:hypothetical protein
MGCQKTIKWAFFKIDENLKDPFMTDSNVFIPSKPPFYLSEEDKAKLK